MTAPSTCSTTTETPTARATSTRTKPPKTARITGLTIRRPAKERTQIKEMNLMRPALSRFLKAALVCAVLLPGLGRATSSVPLRIQTTDGKKWEVPVKSFKGISLSVISTLVKQGKMKEPPEKGNGTGGDMTFILGKDVPAGFLDWVQQAISSGGQTHATGSFAWV